MTLVFSNVIIDDERCIEFTKLASDYNFKTAHYDRCLRSWNKYIEYDGDDVDNEELMFQWEELCLNDFLAHSKEWLWNNKHWTDETLK